MDSLTPTQRHNNMSHVKSVSKPEIALRSKLHSMGLRFRKNDSWLPGSPDIVFPKYKAVIFVNGCFWHGHRYCTHFKVPSSNILFWRHKFATNRKRDRANISKLLDSGYRVGIVWECAITGRDSDKKLASMADKILLWLEEDLATPYIEW